MLLIAVTFSGSGLIPSVSTDWPKNLMDVLLNTHFSLFSVRPASWIRFKTASKFLSCSCCVVPYTSTSSIKHTTSLRPLRISCILLWKYSGADVIPKGSLLKQNLLNGVMKVVIRDDSWDSSTCQNPELASSLVNILAPLICARVCSTEGKICLSLCTLLFSLVKSTQIQTFPFAFGTTTMPEHHSVGCSTFSITPNCNILCNSASTLGKRGIATRLGVVNAYGSQFVINLIL